MTFNPMQHKGIPIEEQHRSWSELNVQPYRKDEVHPYSRARGSSSFAIPATTSFGR